MKKVLRFFYLPAKLREALTRDTELNGYQAQWAMAAAILTFLEMSPAEREACLARLEAYAPEEDYEQPRGREKRVVQGTVMKLQMPPPDRQRIIGARKGH